MTTSSTIPDPIHLIIDCLIVKIIHYYPSELSLNKIRMMIILKMTHCSKEWLWCRVEVANPWRPRGQQFPDASFGPMPFRDSESESNSAILMNNFEPRTMFGRSIKVWVIYVARVGTCWGGWYPTCWGIETTTGVKSGSMKYLSENVLLYGYFMIK